MKLFYVLYAAFMAYKMAAKGTGSAYVGIVDRYGMPYTAIFLGLDREAWRVSLTAIREKQ